MLMESADRLIRYMLPTLANNFPSNQVPAVFGFCIGAPGRRFEIASGAEGQFSHYFLPAGASVCDELTSVDERGLVPAAIASGAGRREFRRHFFTCGGFWSDRPPMRHHRRHELSARLTAVRGLKVSARLEWCATFH